MSQQACFSLQRAGDHAQVLMLDGDFDRSKAAQFEQALEHALDAGSSQVIVDLRGVSFLDPAMLNALVRGFGAAVARGDQVAVIRPNPVVWRAFVLTGLSHQFSAFGRLDDALASHAGPAVA
jgi:anti-sigma B factor antagonist